MIGPGRRPNTPLGAMAFPAVFTMCSPYARSIAKRAMSPSSSIARAPPPPSSAGWNTNAMRPCSSSVRSRKSAAAPSSIATCAS